MSTPVLLSWSGGKDASLVLHLLNQRDDLHVAALLTTVTEGYDRVSMHGTRAELVHRQAEAARVPLRTVSIPQACDNATYERRMEEGLRTARAEGVRTAAFGDIFLDDVRRYREELLGDLGMRALFPLWGADTVELANRFIDHGFEAVLTCVDTEQLDARFAGRSFDRDLLDELPGGVDPCGENGEFHTFVHAGPIFDEPIPWALGERTLRDDRFQFCDVLP